MIFSFKLKPFLWALMAILLLTCSVFIGVKVSQPTGVYDVPNSKYTVVIDAGHGGLDVK